MAKTRTPARPATGLSSQVVLGLRESALWVFGALAFILLEEVLAGYTEHWMVFLGPILVLVVLFARGGLYQTLYELQFRSDAAA